jgi:hypothetical protein
MNQLVVSSRNYFEYPAENLPKSLLLNIATPFVKILSRKNVSIITIIIFCYVIQAPSMLEMVWQEALCLQQGIDYDDVYRFLNETRLYLDLRHCKSPVKNGQNDGRSSLTRLLNRIPQYSPVFNCCKRYKNFVKLKPFVFSEFDASQFELPATSAGRFFIPQPASPA